VVFSRNQQVIIANQQAINAAPPNQRAGLTLQFVQNDINALNVNNPNEPLFTTDNNMAVNTLEFPRPPAPQAPPPVPEPPLSSSSSSSSSSLDEFDGENVDGAAAPSTSVVKPFSWRSPAAAPVAAPAVKPFSWRSPAAPVVEPISWRAAAIAPATPSATLAAVSSRLGPRQAVAQLSEEEQIRIADDILQRFTNESRKCGIYYNFGSKETENRGYNRKSTQDKQRCKKNIQELINHINSQLPMLNGENKRRVERKLRDLQKILEDINSNSIRQKYLKYKAKYLQLQKLVDELKSS